MLLHCVFFVCMCVMFFLLLDFFFFPFCVVCVCVCVCVRARAVKDFELCYGFLESSDLELINRL